MAKRTGGGRVTARNPLARLVDTPQLARVVPHLPPEALHQLIRHYGLEACGEVVALATPGQLTSVFDLDLWGNAPPGRDEQFDADRFGAWLEVLADTGAALAAQTVAAMDESLAIAGFSRFLHVYDQASFAPSFSSDDEHIDADATAHGVLEREMGGYVVRAIRGDAWDAIVATLVALEADHRDRFHAVMRGCRRLSNSTPEIDGLDELLAEPEQLIHEVALDRETRRSQQGYSTPGDARAFLQLAQQPRRPHDGAPNANPIVAAYFRAADEPVASGDPVASAQPKPALDASPTPSPTPEALDAVVEMLTESGVLGERPRALLEGTVSEPSRLRHILPLMEFVRDRDDAACSARSRELGFLANTLVAGCAIQGRAFTPQEASDAAAAICNLGLEQWGASLSMPDGFLVDHDLITAFEVGWAALHEQVGMFVAERLIAVVAEVRSEDAGIRQGLRALRIELKRQRAAGTPWRARGALDVIAMLDMPAWTGLLGLLGECPVLPAAIRATLERRTSAISATAFEFIATSGQIETIQEFMLRLPETLRG